MNGTRLDPQRAAENAMLSKNQEAEAADLLQHPGWKAVMGQIGMECTAAKKAIFATDKFPVESQNFEVARAVRTLHVLSNIVRSVYRRANKEIPAVVESMFT